MRDVAYWPKSFLDEVEGVRVEQGARLWSLGGPSFLYRSPRAAIWIDPYFGGTPDDAVPGAYRATAIPINPGEVRLAEAIISTHDHVDHCHEGTVRPIIAHTGARCVAPRSSAKLMRAWGIPDVRVHEVKPGDTLAVEDVEIRVYPSYDPNEPSAATYVLSSGGTELFVSGDTWNGPGIAEVGAGHRLDCALLAFGRTWYMDEQQFFATARALRPRTLLPFHWEFWRNHTGDLVRFFEVYQREQPGFGLRFLLVGDSMSVGE